jgi:hypothetical protein
LEDIDVEEKIIIYLIFKTWGGEVWTGLLWLRIGTVGGVASDCGNESRGSIK